MEETSMMTYVYKCTSCGAIIEHEKGMQDPHPEKLPHPMRRLGDEMCYGKVRHVFQSHGIHLKGGGFYKSDADMRRMDKNLKAMGDEGLDVYDKKFGVPEELRHG